MDVFNCRISLQEAAAMVRAARKKKLLDGAPAAIFHHLGLMRARIAALQTAFPDCTLHAVAVKANPVVEILREVVRAGAGLEAASIEEVHLALAADCPPECVVFDSPAKTAAEIQQALHWGVYLNVDNFDELNRIAAARRRCLSTSLVGLRVNPLVGGGTIAHTSVATSGSQFGVHLPSARQRIVDAFSAHPWLCGLHVHVGSQGCGLPLLAEAVARLAGLRAEIEQLSGRAVSHLDIGGGLPTVYRTGETAPTPREYARRLEEQSPDVLSSHVRLITEFGRAIQANCGIAISRVEYVKPSRRMATIHFGADLLLRTIYRPEQWAHELFVLDHRGVPKAGKTCPVTLAGPLCFAGDIVAREVPLPPVEQGDWIVIRDVGAYTVSMWSRHCSRGIPPIIGYSPAQIDSVRILRRAETPSDIVRFWGLSSAQNSEPEKTFGVAGGDLPGSPVEECQNA